MKTGGGEISDLQILQKDKRVIHSYCEEWMTKNPRNDCIEEHASSHFVKRTQQLEGT